MNIKRHISIMLVFAFVFGGAGCSKKEDADEKQRLAQEEQDERAAAIANQAIADMDKKAFGHKPPNFDLGLPPEPGNGTTQQPPQQP